MITHSQTYQNLWLLGLLATTQPAVASWLTLTNNTPLKIAIMTESNGCMQKNVLAPGEKRTLWGENSIQVQSIYYEKGLYYEGPWESLSEVIDVCYPDSNAKAAPVSSIRSDQETEASLHFFTYSDLSLGNSPTITCKLFYEAVEEYDNVKLEETEA
jgi:hypothetical protein